MKVTWFSKLGESIGYAFKAWRVLSDWKKVVEYWNRIGGFKAETVVLLKFLHDCSLYLVEYASWTPIEQDDKIAVAIQYVLATHRDTLEILIDRIRNNREFTLADMSTMVASVGAFTSNESGSAMDVLYIIAMIYKVLQQLKTTQTDNTVIPPDKNPTIDPEPVRQPVRNFIRKLIGKEVAV